MCRVRYVLVLIYYCALLINGLASDLESPCPGVFDYRYHNVIKRTWYGTLTIGTEQDLFFVNSIRILLDSEAERLSLYEYPKSQVSIDTFDNTEYLIDGLNEKVTKEVKLPLTIELTYRAGSIVPKLTAFRVNEATFCSRTNNLLPELVSSTVFNSGTSVTNTQTTKKPQWSVATNTYTPPPVVTATLRPAVGLPGCGTRVQDVAPLIINGVNSRRGEWPWHGALYYYENFGATYKCGISMLTTRYVITAAHCVTKDFKTEDPISPRILHVIFGKTKLSDQNDIAIQKVNVERVIIHQKFNFSNFHNDIALLKLSSNLEITPWVRPICLWSEDERIEYLTSKEGTIIGWGVTTKGVASDTLQHAKIPVIDPYKCFHTDKIFYNQYSSPKSYCAGILGSTSACNGDSGGGMVFKRKGTVDIWQIRGLVSITASKHGEIICDINHYVIFTDVARYIDWILSYIPELK